MAKRPAGVMVAAVVLGLGAFLALLSGFGSIVAALGAGAPPVPAVAPPGAPTLSPAVLTAAMLSVALLYLGIASWWIATLIGLLRLRSWARVSAIVIGACVAGLGLVCAVSTLALGSVVSSGVLPQGPQIDPVWLHRILLGMALFFLLVAAAGIGFVVYFALHRTRRAFHGAQNPLPAPIAYPSGSSVAALAAMRRPSSLRPAPPLSPADFAVAEPLSTAPETATESPLVAPLPPGALAVEAAKRQEAAVEPASHRPAAVTVLAIVLLVFAFFALVGIVSPVPLFVCGVLMSGLPAHLLSLALACLAGICGLGLLRLQRPALSLTFGLLGLYAINALSFLVPAARRHFAGYIGSVMQASTHGVTAPPLPAALLSSMLIFSSCLNLGLVVLAAWLLWRARHAFELAGRPDASSLQRPDA